MLAGLKLGQRISEMGSCGRGVYFRGVKVGTSLRWAGQNRVAVLLDIWAEDGSLNRHLQPTGFGFATGPLVGNLFKTDTILLSVEDFVGPDWRFEITEEEDKIESMVHIH